MSQPRQMSRTGLLATGRRGRSDTSRRSSTGSGSRYPSATGSCASTQPAPSRCDRLSPRPPMPPAGTALPRAGWSSWRRTARSYPQSTERMASAWSSAALWSAAFASASSSIGQFAIFFEDLPQPIVGAIADALLVGEGDLDQVDAGAFARLLTRLWRSPCVTLYSNSSGTAWSAAPRPDRLRCRWVLYL